MNEEMKKLMEELVEKLNEKEDKRENNFEETRKAINEQLSRPTRGIIFANENGTLLLGHEDELLASLMCVIEKFVKYIDNDLLIYTIVCALARKEDNTYNREMLDNLLKEIKERY